MSEKTLEREMKKAEQERLSGSNHPDDSTDIGDKAGSSMEKKQSDNTSENSTTSSSKESCLTDSTLIYTSLTEPIGLFYHNVFTKPFFKGLDLRKVKRKSDKEFTQYERIQDTISLILKAVNRYKVIEKIHIKHYLEVISTHSTQTSEDIKDTKLKIKDRLDKSKMRLKTIANIRQCLLTCRKFDKDLIKRVNMAFGGYFKELVKTKLQRKFRKGRKLKKKLKSPENPRVLVTPSDRHIALLLSALINSSELVLLPALRGLEVIPKCNLPPKKYFCRNTPESIREHMAILEKLLSDSKDLKFKTVYIFDFQNFLDKSRKLMNDCIFLHDILRSLYNISSESIKRLDKLNLPVTREKYEKMTYGYFKARNMHNALKNAVRKCLLADQRRLQEVSKYLLELVNQLELGDTFLAILDVFAWLPTVPETYAYFIEEDEMYLNVYKKTLRSLVHGNKDEYFW